jgi:hypothetical protein
VCTLFWHRTVAWPKHRVRTDWHADQVLNKMRAQLVRAKRNEAMQALDGTNVRDMELALAMGTHYRLGVHSAVDMLRKHTRDALRGRHARGGKSAPNMLEKIMRRDVRVPQDYGSIAEALTASGAVHGHTPFVSLNIYVAKGTYVVHEPLAARCRVVIEAEAGCKLGDVVLRMMSPAPVVSLVDDM